MKRMQFTQLMGILNVTPDSFYDQGAYGNYEAAIKRGIEMEKEGADWIDVGGESTRPGAQYVPVEDELKRVIPLIEELHKQLSIPISIDTRKVEVAREALKAGASLINDVSGFSQKEMTLLAAETGCYVCVMHMQGTPQTMQLSPHYERGVVEELLHWFDKRIQNLLSIGIQESKIILDPGIGFGKTVADNLKILQNLPKFRAFGLPLLLGISRKSFLGKILNKDAKDLLPATIAANMLGIFSGANYIRVHDVKEHRDALEFFKQLKPGDS